MKIFIMVILYTLYRTQGALNQPQTTKYNMECMALPIE